MGIYTNLLSYLEGAVWVVCKVQIPFKLAMDEGMTNVHSIVEFSASFLYVNNKSNGELDRLWNMGQI